MNTPLNHIEQKNPREQKSESTLTGTIPVVRLALTAGLCFGLLTLLAILKHVFRAF